MENHIVIEKRVNNSMGLGSILFIVFLILKLTGCIGWSWWWVTAPLWIGPAIIISFILIVLGFISLCVLFQR